jgi:hypothetical protein
MEIIRVRRLIFRSYGLTPIRDPSKVLPLIQYEGKLSRALSPRSELSFC